MAATALPLPTTRATRPRSPLGFRLGVAVLLAMLCVLAIGVAAHRRATGVVQRFFREWAPAAVAAHSDYAYALSVGDVHLNWGTRSITVDSLRLTTDSVANGARARGPLAEMAIALRGCSMGGIHVLRLVTRGGIVASSLGCESGSVAATVTRRPGTDPAPAGKRPFLVMLERLELPADAPRLRIGTVDFPEMKFSIGIPWAGGSAANLAIARLGWHMSDVAIDPSDSTATGRPLFSGTIEVEADTFVVHTDGGTELRAAGARASLTDSAVSVRGVHIAPTPDTVRRRYQHDVTTMDMGEVRVLGIDAGAAIRGEGWQARRIAIDSFHVRVSIDKRLPPNPVPPHHLTPQAWVAQLDEGIAIDSVLLHRGQVVYRQHAEDHAEEAVITFDSIDGTAVNVRHGAGGRNAPDTMVLALVSRVADAGRFTTRFAVPLDAPRFDMTVTGTLAEMPATRLNPVVAGLLAYRITDGALQRLDLDIAVAAGRARGTVTPRYTGLEIAMTREGASGILGGGGTLGTVARGVATELTNRYAFRANNPEGPDTPPVVGAVSHTFMPSETLPRFLWVSVRGGLMAVVRK